MTGSIRRAAFVLGAAALGAGIGYWVSDRQAASGAEALADDLLQLTWPRRAIETFEARHDRSPEEPLARAGLALAHYGEGQRALRGHRYDEAAGAFQRAIALRGDVSAFHGELAGALASEGRLPQALAACQEAVRLDPESVGARLRCFHLLLESERAAEAAPVLEPLVRRAADQPDLKRALPDLFRLLAHALEREGDAEAAAAQRERADDLESR